MPQLTQYQRDAVLVLRTRLNPRDPLNKCSEDIKRHLEAIRPWLDSWVIPAVDAIDSSNDYSMRWLREAVSRDARQFRIAAGRGAHAPDQPPLDARERARCTGPQAWDDRDSESGPY